MPYLNIGTCRGVVKKGKGLGHTVGMPTANIDCGDIFSRTGIVQGVYATKIIIEGLEYRAVTNVGTKPTVDSSGAVNIETYILDFDRDIYGQEIEIQFVKYLRAIQKFDNLNEVKCQVAKDIEATRLLL